MSGGMQDDAFLKALAGRARARAAEHREIEDRLREDVSPAQVSGIVDALEEQARRESVKARGTTRRLSRARRPALVWLAAAAVPVLAAAASVLLIVRGDQRRSDDTSPAEYVASVSGHVEKFRGGGEDVGLTSLEARPDAIQEVILRPRARSASPIAAKVLVVRGGVGAPVDVATELSESGVVRFEIAGGVLASASEVRVVIAPPREIDAAVEGARSAAAPARRDVVVVRVPVNAR